MPPTSTASTDGMTPPQRCAHPGQDVASGGLKMWIIKAGLRAFGAGEAMIGLILKRAPRR
jgi:hypothetical protein